ncbi:hypothetical protein J7E62_24665 [Variovorax paradoxus]|nr:hypothetical protein [Variovorax paradoxus]
MSNQLQAQEPSYPAFVRKLFNRSGDPSKDFSHAILGVATETHEYLRATDRVNAIEELGDNEFYVEAATQVIEDFLGSPLPMSDIESEVESDMRLFLRLTPLGQIEMLSLTINQLLDHAKRWIGYERAPASLPAVFVQVLFVQQASREIGIVRHADATKALIRSVNMAKLLKRYPGGDFDQFRALQRDLGAERATLESAVLV